MYHILPEGPGTTRKLNLVTQSVQKVPLAHFCAADFSFLQMIHQLMISSDKACCEIKW
jgi:hypothetical protein